MMTLMTTAMMTMMMVVVLECPQSATAKRQLLNQSLTISYNALTYTPFTCMYVTDTFVRVLSGINMELASIGDIGGTSLTTDHKMASKIKTTRVI